MHINKIQIYVRQTLFMFLFFYHSTISSNRCLLKARYFSASADLRLTFKHPSVVFLLTDLVFEPQPPDPQVHALPMHQNLSPIITIRLSVRLDIDPLSPSWLAGGFFDDLSDIIHPISPDCSAGYFEESYEVITPPCVLPVAVEIINERVCQQEYDGNHISISHCNSTLSSPLYIIKTCSIRYDRYIVRDC